MKKLVYISMVFAFIFAIQSCEKTEVEVIDGADDPFAYSVDDNTKNRGGGDGTDPINITDPDDDEDLDDGDDLDDGREDLITDPDDDEDLDDENDDVITDPDDDEDLDDEDGK